jgi:ubiquinol-cytochrome c reductase cytochrome b subunit
LLARDGQPFWPDAAWRDVVFGFAVNLTDVVLADIVGPPEL